MGIALLVVGVSAMMNALPHRHTGSDSKLECYWRYGLYQYIVEAVASLGLLLAIIGCMLYAHRQSREPLLRRYTGRAGSCSVSAT